MITTIKTLSWLFGKTARKFLPMKSKKHIRIKGDDVSRGKMRHDGLFDDIILAIVGKTFSRPANAKRRRRNSSVRLRLAYIGGLLFGFMID